MQPQYNLVYREEEREMLPLCISRGIGVIPWSPLARGFLAGGRTKPAVGDTERSRTDQIGQRLYYREADFAVVDAVTQVAKERGVSNTQIALAWHFTKAGVTAPIIGATKVHHISEAIAALDISLDAKEVARMEAPYQPKPVLDHS